VRSIRTFLDKNRGIDALIMFVIGFGHFTWMLAGNKADPIVLKSALQTLFVFGVGTISMIVMQVIRMRNEQPAPSQGHRTKPAETDRSN
jgi:hypothetical protein